MPDFQRYLITSGPVLLSIATVAYLISLPSSIDAFVENQNTYVAHAIGALSPQFFHQDWFIAGTHDPQPAFTLFVRHLATLGELVPLMAAVLVLLTTLSLAGLVQLSMWLNRAFWRPVFSIVLIWWIVSETGGVAGSYIFDGSLQPSAFGGAFFLLAFLSFARKRLWLAGGFLALSGLFHVNYLVLGLPVLGLSVLVSSMLNSPGVAICWRERFRALVGSGSFWVDTAGLLCLPMLLFAFRLPQLVSVATDPMATEGAQILTQIRAPWHYQTERFLPELLSPLAWGVGVLLILRRQWIQEHKLTHLFGFWVACLTFLCIATVCTTVVELLFVQQLFVWRLAPYFELASLILLAVFVVSSAPLGGSKARAIGLLALGVVVLCLRLRLPSLAQLDGLYVMAAVSVLAGIRCLYSGNLLSSRVGGCAAWGTVLVAIAVTLQGAYANFSTFHDEAIKPISSESKLYLGVQNSAENALFLVPPHLQGFRLAAKRAIVVDWKSAPFRGSELVEWYQRIKAVAGGPATSEFGAVMGYSRMGLARLKRLEAQYGVDYAVFDKRMTRWLPNEPRFYENKRYVVVRLADMPNEINVN